MTDRDEEQAAEGLASLLAGGKDLVEEALEELLFLMVLAAKACEVLVKDSVVEVQVAFVAWNPSSSPRTLQAHGTCWSASE